MIGQLRRHRPAYAAYLRYHEHAYLIAKPSGTSTSAPIRPQVNHLRGKASGQAQAPTSKRHHQGRTVTEASVSAPGKLPLQTLTEKSYLDENEDTDKRPLRTDSSDVWNPFSKLQAEPDLVDFGVLLEAFLGGSHISHNVIFTPRGMRLQGTRVYRRSQLQFRESGVRLPKILSRSLKSSATKEYLKVNCID